MEQTQFSITLRSRSWEDVRGHGHLVAELQKRAITNNWPTTMLFQGQFGIGKTTLGLLCAGAMTCTNLSPQGNPCGTCESCTDIATGRFTRDIRMIDGASDEGKKQEVVNVIREARSAPLYYRRKVFIIEEIDQLSSDAQLSLLKALEAPRPRVHFILLSMDNNGLPPSVLSRCQHYRMKPLPVVDVGKILYENLMQKMKEGSDLYQYPDMSTPEAKAKVFEVLMAFAEKSRGSPRWAQQDLERALIGGYWTADLIEEAMDIVSSDTVQTLVNGLAKKDPSVIPEVLKRDNQKTLFLDIQNLVADLSLYLATGYASSDFREQQIKALMAGADRASLSELVSLVAEVANTPRPYFDVSMWKLAIGQYMARRVVASPAGITSDPRPSENQPVVKTRSRA